MLIDLKLIDLKYLISIFNQKPEFLRLSPRASTLALQSPGFYGFPPSYASPSFQVPIIKH